MNAKTGSYILFIEIRKEADVKIGKMGKLRFRAGLYAYIGSAMNGLEKRTERHVRIVETKNGKLKWHIDYLLADQNSELVALAKIQSSEKIECEISRAFRFFADPMIGFGSSDCVCRSHLYYLGF